MPRHQRILAPANPYSLIINKDLAAEIGLNESIVLLQLDFLISIARHERDGMLWTYQSTSDLQKNCFPWWSRDTINRAIRSLEESGFIHVGNYNRRKADKTRWFAINAEGCRKLRSVVIAEVETGIAPSEPEEDEAKTRPSSTQNRTGSTQNRTGSTQNRTTLPETTTETTPETSSLRSFSPSRKKSRPLRSHSLSHAVENGMSEERLALRERLLSIFLELTGLPGPTSYAQREKMWFKPLNQIAAACDWDETAAVSLVKSAISHMDNNKLSMKCPSSILTVALNMRRRHHGDEFTTAWREF